MAAPERFLLHHKIQFPGGSARALELGQANPLSRADYHFGERVAVPPTLESKHALQRCRA